MSGLSKSRWANPSPVSQETGVSDQQKATPDHNVDDTKEKTAPSGLSGAAQTFAPAPAPPPDTSIYDEFTRTGADQDDLFDDFIPESMQTREQDDIFGDDITPIVEPAVQDIQPARQELQETRGDQRDRGRGRGRGRGGREVRNNARTDKAPDDAIPASPAQAPENAPTGPRKETAAAVRGDRFATGGIRKPKLSEAELAEKMAAISMKNASLTAAHARAEADAASFAQREAQAKDDASKRQEDAKVRAREERKDRQQMMGEREKNRLRKLKAMEGREWDAEKHEDDFSKGGRYDQKGGFAGDKTDYTDGREYLLRDAKPSNGKQAYKKEKTQSVPQQEDFPALGLSKVSDFSRTTNNAAVKSWADQVESAGS